METVKEFFKGDREKILLESVDREGRTPFMIAAFYNSAAVVKWLMHRYDIYIFCYFVLVNCFFDIFINDLQFYLIVGAISITRTTNNGPRCTMHATSRTRTPCVQSCQHMSVLTKPSRTSPRQN